MNEDNEDRKLFRRNSFKNKHLNKKTKNQEARDSVKIKKERKSRIERMKEDEIWEDWENEIY